MREEPNVAETIDWGFPSGTWEEAEAQVGEVIGSFAGPDAVSHADIRRRLEVMEWDCPLHHDESVAREHGYEGVVSPASMYMIWALPLYWEPGKPRNQDLQHRFMPSIPMVMNIPGEGSGMLDAECSVEFHAPIYPGDKISATSKIASVTRKKTSIGDGAFIVVESTYTKQSGEVVAVDRITLYRYHPIGEANGDA
jgi:hypothetical protein